MNLKELAEKCPGLCISTGLECALDEMMLCSKKLKFQERMEETAALREGIWFVEVL
jgi:hypothetical protein